MGSPGSAFWGFMKACAQELARAASLFIVLATLLYDGWYAGWFSFITALLLLPFVATLVVGRWLPKAAAELGFLVSVFASLLASFQFFSGAMHDLGLLFGSHGRWGCQDLSEDGSSAYLLNERSVPLLLFVPAILATAYPLLVTAPRWRRARRHRNR